MTTPSAANPIELKVTNFGPIAEGNFELRPMTVFVGPSNSGKSFMAGLVYALHNFFKDDFPYLHARGEFSYDSILTPLQESQLTEDNCNFLLNWYMELFPDLVADNALTRGRIEDSPIELPSNVVDLVRPYLENVSGWGNDLGIELARCFGVDAAGKLIRYPAEDPATISLRRFAQAERTDCFGYDFALTTDGLDVKASVSEASPFQIGSATVVKRLPMRWQMNPLLVRDEPRKGFAITLLVVLANEIAYRNIDSLPCPALYLPAGRAGVMHASQVVVQTLIASASRPVHGTENSGPSISGVLGDYLEQLVSLVGASQREKGIYAELAGNLENDLLRGAVKVERKEIDYPSFVFRPHGWKRDLPLINSSSMVSELLPVVLYLRHVVQPGDLLILEEPEAHLHPKMQAMLIRQLVAAVQSGVRILITTHSEWILEELANLVRLAELPADRRAGIEDSEIHLNPAQLGAWFFEQNEDSEGSVAREISLDEESATFPAGFGLVADSLYNRWVEISTRIEEE